MSENLVCREKHKLNIEVIGRADIEEMEDYIKDCHLCGTPMMINIKKIGNRYKVTIREI